MFTLNCKGKLLTAHQPLVMGIINITPDSFYIRSRGEGRDQVLRMAEQMLKDGADIIDIGAQSTRPGSEWLTAEEELKRIDNIIETVSARFPEAVISIDTFHSRVAEAGVSAGAAMINDISGGMLDNHMLEITGGLGVPYVCMHMKGTPQTMPPNDYDNIILELTDYFIARLQECRKAGIKDVIIDPGFGFSKNIHTNFELLKRLEELTILGAPLLVGLSRKSTIYKTLGTTAAEALNGTTVLNTISLMHGAAILRVHDVKEAKECIQLWGKVH